MDIKVTVVPKSSSFKFTRKQGKIRIFLKSPAEGNKANLELIKQMKKLFKKEVCITSGLKARRKTLSIDITENEWETFLSKIQ